MGTWCQGRGAGITQLVAFKPRLPCAGLQNPVWLAGALQNAEQEVICLLRPSAKMLTVSRCLVVTVVTQLSLKQIFIF